MLRVHYARLPLPVDSVRRSIFLAGPTPRDANTPSWRPEACRLLREELCFEGEVFVPEDEGGGMHGSYEDQVAWESDALHRADCIVFFVPRHMDSMPGLTTNDEWGYWKDRGAVLVWGNPPDAVKCRYQRSYAKTLGVPICDSLEETLRVAVERVGPGALRQGPQQVIVPAYIFQSPSYQHWVKVANIGSEGGNELRALQVKDCVWVGGQVFMWRIWAAVYIREEDRVKDNEVVIGRLNVCSTVVHLLDPADRLSSKVVLVKEFRTSGGHMYDLPGGSSSDASLRPISVALEELGEEIDLRNVSEADMTAIGAQAAFPSLLSHHNVAFSLPVSPEVIEHFERLESQGVSFGNEHDTERTFVCVRTVRQMMEICDWTTIGIVCKAIFMK